MTFLIDMNIVSEVRKGIRADPAVESWWNSVAEDDFRLGPLVLGEVHNGVELARRRDHRRAEALDTWLVELTLRFGNRILPIDTAVAEQLGRMNAIRPGPVIDALLAATAKANRPRRRGSFAPASKASNGLVHHRRLAST